MGRLFRPDVPSPPEKSPPQAQPDLLFDLDDGKEDGTDGHDQQAVQQRDRPCAENRLQRRHSGVQGGHCRFVACAAGQGGQQLGAVDAGRHVVVAVQVVPNETSSVTSWLVTARPGSSGAVTGVPATVTFASTGVPEILIWSFT